jgi:low density lipoprotein receptor-related protein 5/6
MIDPSTSRKRVGVWLATALLTSAGVPVLGGNPTLRAVFRANTDGTGVEQVIPSNAAEGRGALTVDQQHVYWAGGLVGDQDSSWIRRSDLDGNNMSDFIGHNFYTDMKIDSLNAKLYFTNVSDCFPGCGAVTRINLDGSNFEMIFSANSPRAIAVYPPADLVCWSDSSEAFVHEILCATVGDLTGQVVVTDTAAGLAIDPLQQKLYWTAADRIRRSNLDGSVIEDLVLGLDSPKGIVLDPQGDAMWWTERIPGKIQRANLDGSNVQDIVSGLDSPIGIGFVTAPAAGPNDKIYWVSAAPPAGDGGAAPSTTTIGVTVLLLLLLGGGTYFLRRPPVGRNRASTAADR